MRGGGNIHAPAPRSRVLSHSRMHHMADAVVAIKAPRRLRNVMYWERAIAGDGRLLYVTGRHFRV